MENINEHDMTKRMLDAIRGGTNSSPLNENVQTNNASPKEQLDEHDMTKDMLAKIRNMKPINEEVVSGPLLTEGIEGENEDVVKVDDDEASEQASIINDIVGGVDLKLYEVYPKDRNVVMVGVLDNGIDFKFSKKEQAPYINVDNMKLDSETLETVKRLEGYYKSWVEDWNKKISEYTQNV